MTQLQHTTLYKKIGLENAVLLLLKEKCNNKLEYKAPTQLIADF